MNHALVSFFMLVLIGSVGYSILQAGQEGANRGKPVPITRLVTRSGPPSSFTSNSGIGDALRIVIRDNEAWRDMWKRIHYPVSPSPPPLPEIDFSQEMVIVVALGARPSGGYGIIIDGAYERDYLLEVLVRSVSPGKGCLNVAMVTQPVDIVRLPKTQGTVVFRETEVVRDCK